VIATNGTVASRAYTQAILRCRPDAAVTERPASWLVPVIESGTAEEAEVEEGLERIVFDMREAGVDAIILGCTHFPLLRHLFDRVAGPGITILDSATTTAREVRRLLEEFSFEASAEPRHRFLVTGPARSFAERVAAMFHTFAPIETVDFASGLVDVREAG
jgi:glutamate racemase